MRIVIVGIPTISASLMGAIIQATPYACYQTEPTARPSDMQEMILEIKNYRDEMNRWLYDVVDFFDYIEDYILPKVKPLYSQVFSRKPINNPIAGRCY